MLKAIDKPREDVGKYAPKVGQMNIDVDKIKDVIGSGGKMINKIIDETGVKIDINDDGVVFVASTNAEMNEKAKQIILGIATDIEVGKTYFIDTSSIHGDSEGNWYAEVSKDKTMTVYIGRMNLKHFKSA